MAEGTQVHHHDPPPYRWVIIASGYIFEVDDFVRDVCISFKELHPNIIEFDGDDDQTKAVIHLEWRDDPYYKNLLLGIIPNYVTVHDYREANPCQETS